MKKLKRGFALMSKSQQRRIASMGGKASQAGSGNKFTTKTARKAGRLGGLARQKQIRKLNKK